MKKNKTYQIVMIAMFIALEVVLEIINSQLPSLPQGGTLSFSICTIFLASYLMGVKEGVIVGAGSAIVLLLIGQFTFYGWWSLALDYIVPLAVCGLAGVIKNVHFKGREYPVGIFFAMFLKFISHYLSGALLFAEYAPEGQSPYFYSLWYNAYYCIPTAILCFILVTLLLPKLKRV